jgi:hypothetical protein
MPSRGTSITIVYTAWDNVANAPKTGDVANHTLRWIKDGTASAPTNAASEVDSTNVPGEYKLTLTTTEGTCDFGKLAGKSSTAGVSIIGVAVTFEAVPLTGAQMATAIWQDATAGDFTVASSIGKALYIANVAPGAAGGHFIAGSNAATTISGLTTGALSCTTITASGAVAFQSTFAVTTSTALGAISGSTVTFSGAVAFQSTFAVTGAFTATNASNSIVGCKISTGTGAGQLQIANGQVFSEMSLHNGTAQAGGASTITLAAGASATTDFYKNRTVNIIGGTGAGQTNGITAYNGTTKVATVKNAWAVQPDATSLYSIEAFTAATTGTGSAILLLP